MIRILFDAYLNFDKSLREIVLLIDTCSLNADSEVKFNVIGLRNCMYMERCCPWACVCLTSKCSSIGKEDMRIFQNFNADFKRKRGL